jgi:cystathionine beta-lyase/cystathionine gamma-synthase
MAPQMLRPRDLTPDQLELSGITEATIRLSVGLEDVEDLIADLSQALEKAVG